MLTKVVYFRPDKRFVKDDDLNNKYACLIKDEFTTAESSITVPAYLTVFQHYIPKLCMKKTKSQKRIPSSSYQFQEKLCFYLIGSKQAPPLHELIPNVTNIDRIEFKGHIGFEQPIFEILNQFSSLRKVTFSINICKQGNFIFDDDKELIYSQTNMLVTNLNIFAKKCEEYCNMTCSCRNAHFSQNPRESIIKKIYNDKPASMDDKEDTLKTMIIRLLQRISKQCTNIKRLTMDVPKYKGLRTAIENSMQEMSHLKPSKISDSNDRILVCKGMTDVQENETQASTGNDTTVSSDDPEITVIQMDVEDQCSLSQLPIESKEVFSVPEEVKENAIEKSENVPNGNNDEVAVVVEPVAPCLFDMSKLLGSMLGIPTSSLPSSSAGLSSSSSSSLNLVTSPPTSEQASKPNSNTCESPNLDDFQPLLSTDGSMNSPDSSNQHTSASSSTVEVITYAAAAAAATAAATANNTTATTTTTICNGNINRHHHNHLKSGGNDIGSYHHRHHHHINEGSRRTFLKDGEGPELRDEEESARSKHYIIKSNKKPSIPYVADLGKPVVISSSCKSPHKRII